MLRSHMVILSYVLRMYVRTPLCFLILLTSFQRTIMFFWNIINEVNWLISNFPRKRLTSHRLPPAHLRNGCILTISFLFLVIIYTLTFTTISLATCTSSPKAWKTTSFRLTYSRSVSFAIIFAIIEYSFSYSSYSSNNPLICLSKSESICCI